VQRCCGVYQIWAEEFARRGSGSRSKVDRWSEHRWFQAVTNTRRELEFRRKHNMKGSRQAGGEWTDRVSRRQSPKIQALGRRRVLIAISLIQDLWRRAILVSAVRARFLALRDSARRVQHWYRCAVCRKRYCTTAKGLRLIQRVWRGARARNRVQSIQTQIHLEVERAFLNIQLERERLWLAVLEHAIFEVDARAFAFPLCVDLAVNVCELYPDSWTKPLADHLIASAGTSPRILSIACTASSSCVILGGGELWTYGCGDKGQLGQGTVQSLPSMKQVRRFHDGSISSGPSPRFFVRKVVCGDDHSTLLTEGGEVLAFGSNKWGQLGTPSPTATKQCLNIPRLVGIRRSVVDIACGAYHTVALLDGGVVMEWGSWSLRRDDTRDLSTPRRVMKAPRTSRSVHCGRAFSAVLAHDGYIWSWGSNTHGQLGTGSDLSAVETPAKLMVRTAVKDASKLKGGELAIILSSHGTEEVGRVAKVQVADSKPMVSVVLEHAKSKRSVPISALKILAPLKLRAVACGGAHCVGLRTNGTVVSWGSNSNGQLGIDTEGSRVSWPQRVDTSGLGGSVVDVAAGLRHSIAVTADHRVLAWGKAGSFRFVGAKSFQHEPGPGTGLENEYTCMRQPKLPCDDLKQFPGLLNVNLPVVVAEWPSSSPETPTRVSAECNFNRGISITTLQVEF